MIKTDPEVIRELVDSNKRIHGRDFDKYRDIKIEPNVINLAEGSCHVKLGDTDVIVGVKFETGTPYPDHHDEGSIMVGAEFVTFASSDFEPGPPSEKSIEVARVVDRCIRESKAIDFKKLCIKEGEKVWIVTIDIDIINADGNLIDASCLAAMKALLNAKMPELDKDMNIDRKRDRTKKLLVDKIAVNTTFVKIKDKILVDPTRLEEDAMDASLTIGTFETMNGKENGICAMQKGGCGGFTPAEVEQIIDMAEAKGKELRALIK